MPLQDPIARREHKREYNRQYFRVRYKQDASFRMMRVLRCRLRNALQNRSKSTRTLELLGCTVDDLIAHLESKLLPGQDLKDMQIDHIKPCASFDLTDPEQQRQCFHYSNLQPLTASENMSKGARWTALDALISVTRTDWAQLHRA